MENKQVRRIDSVSLSARSSSTASLDEGTAESADIVAVSESLRSDELVSALRAVCCDVVWITSEPLPPEHSADDNEAPRFTLSDAAVLDGPTAPAVRAVVLDSTAASDLDELLDNVESGDWFVEDQPPVVVLAIGADSRSSSDAPNGSAGLESSEFAYSADPILRALVEERVTAVVTMPFNPHLLALRLRRLLRAEALGDRLSRWSDHLDRVQRIGRLGLWEWDIDANSVQVSHGARVLLDLPSGDGPISLETLRQAVHPDDRLNFERTIMDAVRDAGSFSFDHRLAGDDDLGRTVLNAGEVATSADRNPRFVNGVVVDITDRHLAERQVRQLSYFDRLTALPNASMFRELLGHELSRSRRSVGRLAVLWLDLNRFKEVNESVGHDVGDVVLKETAKRLVRRVRGHGSSEGEGTNVVARHGGDKFLVMLGGLAADDEIRSIAQELIDEIARPFVMGDQELFLSASLGVSRATGSGDEVGALLRRAETAMYFAKRTASQRPQLYDPEMNEAVVRRFDVETKLNRALERGELAVFLQPLLDASSLEVVGAEALLRWNHPELGSVPPSEFIAVAEDSGLIDSIGVWTLRRACEAAAEWPTVNGRALRLAVNVSNQQMRREGFAERVAEILADVELAPDRLELEMTERIAMSQEAAVANNLKRLRELGVSIAIDDFGTGHSALSYLTRFPVDTLKIDRSFIHGLPDDPGSRAVTAAIAAMAKSMGLRIVAEGIETEEQIAFVREQGCDELQGFLFSPAIDAVAFCELLRDGGRVFSAPL